MADLRDVLLAKIEDSSVKRQPVAAACSNCKRRKQKCSGRRPCEKCVARAVDCVYETRKDETRQQATKRKHHELAGSYAEQSRLIEQLAGGDEKHAVEVFRRLRAGEPARSIVRKHLTDQVEDPVALVYEQRVQQSALIALCRSTASLDDLVGMAAAVLSGNTRLNVLNAAFDQLRDRIITLEVLTGVLGGGGVEEDSIANLNPPDGTHDGPKFWVTAEPWTDMVKSDEAVSHLISIFLTYGNPYFRFVEEDLFLRAMRSRKPITEYCSPFLIHAILSWAATYTELEEACSTPSQLLTRGLHFHNEALRLWKLEQKRPSLTNIQALLIMAVDAGVRGKDRLVGSLLRSAASTHSDLAPLESLPMDDRAAADYSRARRVVACTLTWLDLGNAVNMWRNSKTVNVDVNEMPPVDNFPDTTLFWVGSPFTEEPMPLKYNVLLRERGKLAALHAKLVNLLHSDRTKTESPDRLMHGTTAIANEALAWAHNLPAELQQSKLMPSPIFELHAEYLTMMIALYDRTVRAVNFDHSKTPTNPQTDSHAVQTEFAFYALNFAFQAAMLCRIFRQQYGLKLPVEWMILLANQAIFVCLQDLQNRPQQTTAKAPSRPQHPSEKITNTSDAFCECFRFLVGCGTHVLFARGLARMVVQTACQLDVPLPDPLPLFVEMVAETTWAVGDLELMDSEFPNYFYKNDTESDDNTMENLLRQWEQHSLEEEAGGTEVE